MTRTHMVNGNTYEVWSDTIKRGTFAREINTGEVKQLIGGGYISKDLTTRKAIAIMFNLPTFGAKAVAK